MLNQIKRSVLYTRPFSTHTPSAFSTHPFSTHFSSDRPVSVDGDAEDMVWYQYQVQHS